MRWLVLPLLFLSLVLPLGLQLDLCGCAGGGHALFCGAEEAPAEEPSSCCAPKPVERPECAADSEEPCPGCPVVDLPELQLDLPAAPSSFDYPLALAEPAAAPPELGAGFRPAWTAGGSRAPPGKVPRYLLFGRIRC